MAKTDADLVALLEPEVEGLPPEYAAAMSIAISLKRLSDFLAGSACSEDVIQHALRELQIGGRR